MIWGTSHLHLGQLYTLSPLLKHEAMELREQESCSGCSCTRIPKDFPGGSY